MITHRGTYVVKSAPNPANFADEGTSRKANDGLTTCAMTDEVIATVASNNKVPKILELLTVLRKHKF